MNPENLYVFESEDWKALEIQFVGFYRPTFEFVTENKGTVAEARDIYVESFVCYTQLLELHGTKLIGKAEQIVYSFSRKLWIKKLEKRRVDLNYVKHRWEFFEMEEAFHEIDSINTRSAKTAGKLAEIGEPFRTLLIECIGRKSPIPDVAPRLGFADEDRAFAQITKGIRKLIKLCESKEFAASDVVFAKHLRYVLDGMSAEKADIPDSDKVIITMISRIVAMIRNYVIRTKRLQVLKELQDKLLVNVVVDTHTRSDHEPSKKINMKPIAVVVGSAFLALVISAITAFGVVGSMRAENEELTLVQDTLVAKETAEPAKVPEPVFVSTAFAINSEGYFLTTASEIRGLGNVNLIQPENGEIFAAEIIFVDSLSGLAVLKAKPETTGIHPVPYRFAPTPAKVGEMLYSLGFPEDNLFYTDGILNYLKDGVGQITLQNSVPGAPVLSSNGQIVGMITAIQNADKNVYRMVTVDRIATLFGALALEKNIQIQLPQRNRLFYSDKSQQIEQIAPLVYRVQTLQ